jgi:hypothetical protein
MIYLHNADANIINGMINMPIACDGTHYIDHQTFFAKLDKFKTTEQSACTWNEVYDLASGLLPRLSCFSPHLCIDRNRSLPASSTGIL